MAVDLQTIIVDDPMKGFENPFFGSRNIETVRLPSGDLYVFFVSQSPKFGNLIYNVTQYSAGAAKTVTTTAQTTAENVFPQGVRTLAGCVVKSRTKSKANVKWIGFKKNKTNEDGTSTIPTSGVAEIDPILELYSPKISYDPLKNRIDLFFWTHLVIKSVTVDGVTVPTAPTYSVSNLALQKPDGTYYTGTPDVNNDPDVVITSTISTVMCHAVGTFTKASLDATLLDQESEGYSEREQVEYIPVFNEPTIVFGGDDVGVKITDLAGAGSGGFPYGDKWAFGIDIDSDTSVNTKVTIYNPFVIKAGVVTSNWFSETLPTLHVKKELTIEIPNGSWEDTDGQGKIIIGYVYNMITNTDSIVASSVITDVSTIPTGSGSGNIEPITEWKVPLYELSATKSNDSWNSPEIYIDFIHGCYSPNMWT